MKKILFFIYIINLLTLYISFSFIFYTINNIFYYISTGQWRFFISFKYFSKREIFKEQSTRWHERDARKIRFKGRRTLFSHRPTNLWGSVSCVHWNFRRPREKGGSTETLVVRVVGCLLHKLSFFLYIR